MERSTQLSSRGADFRINRTDRANNPSIKSTPNSTVFDPERFRLSKSRIGRELIAKVGVLTPKVRPIPYPGTDVEVSTDGLDQFRDLVNGMVEDNDGHHRSEN